MKRSITFCFFLIFLSATSISQTLKDKNKCPPVGAPLLGYTWQSHLGSGISGEYNFWFCHRDCDCTSPLGAVCYLFGTGAGIKLQYFPENKFFDISGNLSYKNQNFIPLGKIQVEAGYSFATKGPGDFFHIDPSVGIDLLMFNLSAGYSFRTQKIDNKIGGFVFHIAISPFIFIRKSRSKVVFTNSMKSSKAERAHLRSSFKK